MPVEIKPISDECGLLRRVTPNQIVIDKNSGKKRLSSGAFRDKELSVDAECLLAEDGLDWEYTLQNYPTFFLIRISAGFARSKGQAVCHVPLDEDQYHAEVKGQKSKTVRNAMRDSAQWVKKPSDWSSPGLMDTV